MPVGGYGFFHCPICGNIIVYHQKDGKYYCNHCHKYVRNDRYLV